MDPKKMIGFAAAAGAVMFTVLALGTGLTGNTTLPPVKPKPALEPAQYDPATVIAPTLAGAATDPNAPIPLHGPQVPAIGQQRSEEHTSELQSLMRISYAVFSLKQQRITTT